MKHLLMTALCGAFLLFSTVAQAETPLPEMPQPIRNLAQEGAQVRYLGRDYGLDAWITIKNGQEQYFYVLPDQSAFVMGVLFNPKGEMITVKQVQKLRSKGDSLLDELADDQVGMAPEAEPQEKKVEFSSPSERLFYSVENSNWVPIGQIGTPVVYAFIEPACPHCHEFIKELKTKGYLDQGKVQVRMIPVGFTDETRAQAAYLLATPNPQERWFRHIDGDPEALPAKQGISQQGVQRNMAIMQSWKFTATPMVIYRGKDGTVKLIQGRPQDIDAMIADIGARS